MLTPKAAYSVAVLVGYSGVLDGNPADCQPSKDDPA